MTLPAAYFDGDGDPTRLDQPSDHHDKHASWQTDASGNVTGLVGPDGITVPIDNLYRRGGYGIACDWSAVLGALTLPTGGTGSAIELDTGVTFAGLPCVKCTFSTTAADTFVGRYAPTNTISFKDFKTILLPVKITAADAVGTVATSANPFGVWLKMASGKQIRLRLDVEGTMPGGWCLLSFKRQETTGVVFMASGATWDTLDSEQVNAIDFVHVAGSGIVSSAYPIWVGPLLRDPLSLPIVSVRMDGNYISQYNYMRPYLANHGIRGSLAVIHSALGTAGRMTTAQVSELYAAGHEVIHHTFDGSKTNGYANATDWASGYLITEDVAAGFKAQRTNGWLRGIGTCVEAFTGNYFGGATTLARQKLVKHALQAAGIEKMVALRTSNIQQNTAGRVRLGQAPFLVQSSISIGSTTTPASVISEIDKAAANGEWLVITMHEIVADSETPAGNQMKASDAKQWIDYLGALHRAGTVAAIPVSEAYDAIYLK